MVLHLFSSLDFGTESKFYIKNIISRTLLLKERTLRFFLAEKEKRFLKCLNWF